MGPGGVELSAFCANPQGWQGSKALDKQRKLHQLGPVASSLKTISRNVSRVGTLHARSSRACCCLKLRTSLPSEPLQLFRVCLWLSCGISASREFSIRGQLRCFAPLRQLVLVPRAGSPEPPWQPSLNPAGIQGSD